ncbi:hypothetical protein BGZ68_000371, partial [Mortierella alpina]
MLGSSNTPAVAPSEQASSRSTPPQGTRTRDKIRNFLHRTKLDAQNRTRTPPPEKKAHTQGSSTDSGNNINNASYSVKVSKSETTTQLTHNTASLLCNIFTQNLGRPSNVIKLQRPGERIDSTPQLVLCNRLLQQEFSADMPVDKEHRDWIKSISQNQVEQDHIRWLQTRMIEEFAKDAVKGSSAVKEIVLLGPVLDREHYRNLLSCFITKFDQTTILDVDLLRGLVQLVQCGSAGCLVENDLVNIMSILRTCLQKTHQQSSEHLYHLTLALSRILDVMAKHEVKDVDRVEQHEPLAAILSSLGGSSDPFLMYQAAYAFQALQCIPDDETALQEVMRLSGAVAEGLVNISGIVNLDLGGLLEGLVKVQKTVVDTIGIAKAAYEGTRSLIESGQDVFNAIKGGINLRNKRAWYPAIVGADALVRAGRLADFKAVVMEAACRSSHEFQWGICQLLGEISLDPVWESAIRQQAVDFLVDLYTNDSTWGEDLSVKRLMLTVLHLVSDGADQDVKVSVELNKKSPDSADLVKFDASYPLVSHLPHPEAWSLLSLVQGVTNVERDIYRLRTKRLRVYSQNVYIPPLAKAGLQASDKDAVLLMEKIKEFLYNDQQVFLLLGDSGAGKSTFNRHLEYELWDEYKHDEHIPVFVNLPAIERPDLDLIGKQLRIHNFTDAQIQELKQHRRIILICDGYDETQMEVNIHKTNLLNQEGQPDTKMIISCRTSRLGSDYRNLFQPQQEDRYNGVTTRLFTEAVIISFSGAQIENYVCQFVRDSEVHKLMGDGPIWSTEEYMTRLKSIPNMMKLVKNPFLLKLALRALPQVVKDAADLANVK